MGSTEEREKPGKRGRGSSRYSWKAQDDQDRGVAAAAGGTGWLLETSAWTEQGELKPEGGRGHRKRGNGSRAEATPCDLLEAVWRQLGEAKSVSKNPLSCLSPRWVRGPGSLCGEGCSWGRARARSSLRTGKVLERTDEGARPTQEKRKWPRSVGKHPGAHLRKWVSAARQTDSPQEEKAASWVSCEQKP